MPFLSSLSKWSKYCKNEYFFFLQNVIKIRSILIIIIVRYVVLYAIENYYD